MNELSNLPMHLQHLVTIDDSKNKKDINRVGFTVFTALDESKWLFERYDRTFVEPRNYEVEVSGFGRARVLARKIDEDVNFDPHRDEYCIIIHRNGDEYREKSSKNREDALEIVNNQLSRAVVSQQISLNVWLGGFGDDKPNVTVYIYRKSSAKFGKWYKTICQNLQNLESEE